MADSLIYDLSVSAGDVEEKPFLRKEMLFITDTSQSGNYSMNQVIFETSQLSNNGRWCDYGIDSYFSFPMMLTATVATAGAPNTLITMNSASDYLLCLKNSNYNLIHSMQIEYGNNNVIQLTNYINQYLNFRLHTELSNDDVDVNGPTFGYSKDDSASWQYSATAGPMGRGLTNNANNEFKMSSACQFSGEPCNSGMKKRQGKYQTWNNNFTQTDLTKSNGNGKELIYGVGNSAVRTTGQNFIENSTGPNFYKCYYYDAILRLRDLPFFHKLPLIRGAFMKITINLNQCQFQVTKDANGNLDFNPSTMNLNGGTNPLMVAGSVLPLISNNIASSTVDTVTPATQANLVVAGLKEIALDNVFVACGSANIPLATIISCSVCCGKNYMSYHTGLNIAPLKTNCRLYVPTYIMSPVFENRYIDLGQKTITYNEIFQFPVYNVTPGLNFTNLITNGQARMKRIIICPFVSSSTNGNENSLVAFSPLISPFTCEPGTVSPHAITNFNLSLGGINIYQNNITYGYEHFMNEMTAWGINANKSTGMVSGRISQADWSNNYGYIVCDLSRRLPEDDTTSIAVSITGTNSGLKSLDLFCFIEYEKSIVIDLLSGKKLN